MKISTYVKSKVKISEVFSMYSNITGNGNQKFGHCPKHKDAHPSVSIRDAKGSFRCMSCGYKGDVITIVQDQEGADFMEALKILIENFSIEPPERMYRDEKREKIKKLESENKTDEAFKVLMEEIQ
jgi:DNA primase